MPSVFWAGTSCPMSSFPGLVASPPLLGPKAEPRRNGSGKGPEKDTECPPLAPPLPVPACGQLGREGEEPTE